MKPESSKDKPARREDRRSAGPASRSGRADAAAAAPRRRAPRQRYEGTEGNNALQSEPDDSREVSMLDSGKHSERSPYVAGNQ
jgi:hypothetical protein